MSDEDWIKLQLPAGASFTKNGVTLTVAQAVTAALTDNDDNRFLAVADLLDMLAADEGRKTETIGPYSRSTEANLIKRAAYFRSMAGAVDTTTEFGEATGITRCLTDNTINERTLRGYDPPCGICW